LSAAGYPDTACFILESSVDEANRRAKLLKVKFRFELDGS
jgi:hypothetical protein